MLQVDLTTLSPPELRRLLATTRERGQASLTYQILQEMVARRERGETSLFRGRRAREPRVIAVDLDDPLEPLPTTEADEEDDIPPLPPGWVPQAPIPAAFAALDAAETPRAGPKKARRGKAASVAAPTPKPADPTDETPRDIAAPSRPQSPPEPLVFAAASAPPLTQRPARFSRWSGLIFAAGVSVGLGSGWWAGGVTRALLLGDSAAKLAASARAAHATPAPSVQIVAAPALVAPAPILAPIADAEAAPPSAPVRITKAGAAPGRTCAAAPTPADRTICTHPRLLMLQRDLRRAYAQALLAHQDRALLRQRQLAWRQARNEVAAPDRLARLYDERIRTLHAAAAAARRRARRA